MSNEFARSRRRVDVLGAFVARTECGLLALPHGCERLLALLAVVGDLPRRDVAGQLWPTRSQERALADLRTTLWHVRRRAPGFVTPVGDVLRLAVDEVDLRSIRAWCWRALRGEEPWLPTQHQCSTADLLPGWEDEWLAAPRSELRLMRLYALEAAGQRLFRDGRLAEAATLVSTVLGIDPLRESANRLMIDIHLRDGNRQDAVRQFLRYTRELSVNGGADAVPGLPPLGSEGYNVSDLADWRPDRPSG
jgi:DNA-binding SARP family transcriptional activator